MAKMRGIKPEFWTDGAVASLSPLARLLFIGMWHYCCDNGHLMAKPRDLKIRVLPLDDCDPEVLLEEIAESEPDDPLVVIDEDGYTVPNLRKHQQIHSRWETRCPRCDNGGATVADNGGTTVEHRESTDEVNRTEVKGSEGGAGGEAPGTKAPRKRGTRLPDIFPITTEMREWGREHAPDIEPAREHEKFCDYWRGVSGARGVKLDWTATWRNWMRKAQEDFRPHGGARGDLDGRPDWMLA